MSSSIQVHCHIKDSSLSSDRVKNYCSFFVTKPLSLEKLKNNFPFEGLFHFRIQRHSEDLVGFKVGSFVWLDLVDPFEVFDVHGSFVEVQALSLAEDYGANEEKYFDYNIYLDDMNKIIPTERQSRLYNRDEYFDGNSKPMNMVGKVFSQISQNVKVSAQKLKMESLNSGATNIWKIMKQTAANINIAGLIDSRLCSSSSKLILTELSQKVHVTFDPRNSEHTRILRQLWNGVFPGKKMEPNSPLWKQVGFQKQDPALDLKNSGILALLTLTNLIETYPEKAKGMIETNMSNTKSNYPFAIVGINLTLLMIEVLHLRDQQ